MATLNSPVFRFEDLGEDYLRRVTYHFANTYTEVVDGTSAPFRYKLTHSPQPAGTSRGTSTSATPPRRTPPSSFGGGARWGEGPGGGRAPRQVSTAKRHHAWVSAFLCRGSLENHKIDSVSTNTKVEKARQV